jgi:Ca2+-binding RTX toxin-like protein
MATFTTSVGATFSFPSYAYGGIAVSKTNFPNVIVYTHPSGGRLVVYGTDFTFSAENIPNGGTITDVDFETAGGSIKASLTGLNLAVTDLHAAWFGSANDMPSALMAGDDTITGGAFSDLLVAGRGSDSVDGGGGIDLLIYNDAFRTEGVTVDLDDGNPDDTLGRAWTGLSLSPVTGAEIDTLANIEDVMGTAFADRLIGDAKANVFMPGAGDDFIAGGAGSDGLDYSSDTSSSPFGISVTFTSPSDGFVLDATGGVDDFASIEYVEGTNASDTMTGTAGGQSLYGGDHLFGGADTDSLKGGDGNDYLDGGAGADSLIGGAGDDTYVLGGAFESLAEKADEGYDTVLAGVSLKIGSQFSIEAMAALNPLATTSLALELNDLDNTLTGNMGNNQLEGNGGDDLLIGSGGDDFLIGGPGADTLEGGFGDDLYKADDADEIIEAPGGGEDQILTAGNFTLAEDDEIEILSASGVALGITLSLTGNGLANLIEGHPEADILTGLGGNDSLIGGAGSDTLYGGSGDDRLDGGSGADIMTGDVGSDTYLVDSALDQVIEAWFDRDRVIARVSYTLGAGVEDLVADPAVKSAPLALTGNELANAITGNNGANRLDGAAGADVLTGLGGDDTYVIDSVLDQIVEAGSGFDTVLTSVSLTLMEGVETLTAAGSAALVLTGNSLRNVITGNAGANRLNGGASDDVLSGLGGNDTYLVDDYDDDVVETAGGGTDIVLASGTHALSSGAQVEILRAATPTARTNIILTGNGYGNAITGNAGANTLEGMGGNDILAGSLGKDNRSGGAGRDAFVFDTKLHRTSNVDRISDFSVQDDTIRLENAIFKGLKAGTLKSDAFALGPKASDASDRILYDKASGALSYDRDGTGSAAAVKFAILKKGLALTAADFFVI